MVKSDYYQFIGTYHNVFSQDFCDRVIEQFNDPKVKKHNRQEDDDIGFANGLQKKDLRGYFNQMKDGQKMLDAVIKGLDLCYSAYASKYSSLQQEKSYHFGNINYSGLQIQRTDPGEGYHLWHHEWGPEAFEFFQRFLVYTIYLNDIDEGGETEFLYQHQRIKPVRGSVCLFPPFYTHVHRGNPPLKKPKYIITGWMNMNKDQFNTLQRNE